MTARLDRRALLLAGAVLLPFVPTGCAQPPSAASYLAAPAPLSQARIWFYRDLNPNETLAMPLIRLNGQVAGVSEPGGAFHRDVAPGRYHISVDSYYQDRHNEADVELAAGAEAYAKVLPFDSFIMGGGGMVGGGYRRNSYVVWLYPPEIGRAAVARSYFTAGGS